MSSKDIWYGVLEAGEKTSPVVRDKTIDAGQNKVYLYNYVRKQFVEYALPIVEPKLRELTEEDVSRKELEKSFKAARKVFSSTHKITALADTMPAALAVKKEESNDIDTPDNDDVDDFIDDE